MRMRGKRAITESARKGVSTIMAVTKPEADAGEAAITESARKADQVGDSGIPARARDQLAALRLEAEQDLGPEHPETLTIRNRLAYWTGKAGDPAAACDQARVLLPVVERVCGASHPGSLAVRATLARMTRAANDPAGAADYYATLLTLAERVRGPEHADTLAARAGLAWCTGEIDEKAEARARFAELVPDAVRILGPEHPVTLDCRAGLARWTGSVDAAAARDQFAELLPDAVRVLGPEHLDTLYIRHSVARWTGQAGEPARARELHAELLPIRERNLGPDHPETKTTRSQLARWAKKAASAPVPEKPENIRNSVTEVLARPADGTHRRHYAQVSELIARVDAAESPTDKGTSLESLMSALFAQVPGFTVYESNVRTETEEIDLMVLNDGREPVYSRDPLILVECKNWTARAGRPEFSLLEGKMRNRHGRCTVGFLVSWSGFTETTWREMLRLSRESHVIVCLTGNDIRCAALADDFPEFLRRATLQTLTR